MPSIVSLFRLLGRIDNFRVLFTDWLFIPLLVLAAALPCFARCLFLVWTETASKLPPEERPGKTIIRRWLLSGIGVLALYILLLWPVGMYSPWSWAGDLIFTVIDSLFMVVPAVYAVRLSAKPEGEHARIVYCSFVCLVGWVMCLRNFFELYRQYLI